MKESWTIDYSRINAKSAGISKYTAVSAEMTTKRLSIGTMVYENALDQKYIDSADLLMDKLSEENSIVHGESSTTEEIKAATANMDVHNGAMIALHTETKAAIETAKVASRQKDFESYLNITMMEVSELHSRIQNTNISAAIDLSNMKQNQIYMKSRPVFNGASIAQIDIIENEINVLVDSIRDIADDAIKRAAENNGDDPTGSAINNGDDPTGSTINNGDDLIGGSTNGSVNISDREISSTTSTKQNSKLDSTGTPQWVVYVVAFIVLILIAGGAYFVLRKSSNELPLQHNSSYDRSYDSQYERY